MAFLHEKQGELGQLSEKTKAELEELLDRQQNLLKHEKFVQKLPDKGVKIKSMVTKIKGLLAQFEEVDKTADLFEKMAIDAEHCRKQRWVKQSNEEGSDGDSELEEGGANPLKQLVNREMAGKVIIDQRTEAGPQPAKVEGRESVTMADKGMAASQREGDGEANKGQPFLNSYDRVIRKAEQRPKKHKFVPNSNVKTRDIHELAERLQTVQLLSPGSGKNPPGGVATPPRLSHPAYRDVVTLSGDVTTTTAATPAEMTPSTDVHAPLSSTGGAGDKKSTILNMETSDPTAELNSSSISGQYVTPQGATGTPQRAGRSKRDTAALPSDVIERQSHAPRRLKYIYDECLETSSYSSKPRHESAKLISVDETVELMKQQQNLTEALQVRLATERLAQRLGARMTTWHPEGGASSGSYRDCEAEDSDEGEDAEEEEDELDYPD